MLSFLNYVIIIAIHLEILKKIKSIIGKQPFEAEKIAF